MIYFVGAGSGAPDLITVRGQRLLQQADVIIYAGSLVNPALLEEKKPDCEVYNSAQMTLEEVMQVMKEAEQAGKMTVRLHTGDPCVYGAVREQMDILEQEGIHVRVIDIVTVKPLDRELVLRAAKETGLIVTTENHSIIGGLGEAVSALLCENYPAPVLKNGVKDRFGQVGTLPYLREVYELRAQDIVTMVKRGLQMKTNMGKGV